MVPPQPSNNEDEQSLFAEPSAKPKPAKTSATQGRPRKHIPTVEEIAALSPQATRGQKKAREETINGRSYNSASIVLDLKGGIHVLPFDSRKLRPLKDQASLPKDQASMKKRRKSSVTDQPLAKRKTPSTPAEGSQALASSSGKEKTSKEEDKGKEETSKERSKGKEKIVEGERPRGTQAQQIWDIYSHFAKKGSPGV